jgi:YVTN family beta-propeller protein
MDAVAIVYPYQTEVAETILAGHAPSAMATTGPEAGSYLLVANPTSNSVTVLNIDDRRLVSVVEVGQEPREILITPDNQYALVLNEKSGDLAVVRLYSLDNPQRAHRYKSAALFTLVPVGAKPVSAAVVKL